MEICKQCEKGANGRRFVGIDPYEREFVLCSSRCLLEYALKEYMQHSDNKLVEARDSLKHLTTAVETALANDPSRLNGIRARIASVEGALRLIDHGKAKRG